MGGKNEFLAEQKRGRDARGKNEKVEIEK